MEGKCDSSSRGFIVDGSRGVVMTMMTLTLFD